MKFRRFPPRASGSAVVGTGSPDPVVAVVVVVMVEGILVVSVPVTTVVGTLYQRGNRGTAVVVTTVGPTVCGGSSGYGCTDTKSTCTGGGGSWWVGVSGQW